MKYFHLPFKGEVHNCLKDATYPLPEERLVESRRKERSSLIMSFLVKTLHPLAISIHFRLVLTSDLMGMQWWLDKCICHQYKSCQMRWVWFISKHFYIKLGVGSWKSMHISASSLARWSASKPCFCFQWLLRLLVSWSIFPQLKLVKFELRCAEFLLDFVLVNKNLKNCMCTVIVYSCVGSWLLKMQVPEWNWLCSRWILHGLLYGKFIQIIVIWYTRSMKLWLPRINNSFTCVTLSATVAFHIVKVWENAMILWQV